MSLSHISVLLLQSLSIKKSSTGTAQRLISKRNCLTSRLKCQYKRCRIWKRFNFLSPETCSGSGSTCFWASRIRIHLLEVWIRILIPLSSCKNSKKNLDSYYFVTLFDFLSLENYVNVPSNSNKQKNFLNKNCFCWHLEGQ